MSNSESGTFDAIISAVQEPVTRPKPTEQSWAAFESRLAVKGQVDQAAFHKDVTGKLELPQLLKPLPGFNRSTGQSWKRSHLEIAFVNIPDPIATVISRAAWPGVFK